ncbi:MAG: hypothetical protein COA58_10330 [Bacteroidetes bacterium]|nr:MAG: hypothetical protein COA58_10330 [Bacteroidota bacterium]
MINLRFSKLPKHRKFNYQPVFYNEEKEELHARVDDIKREMGDLQHTGDTVKENIRRAYKVKQQDTRYGTTPSAKFYSLRLVIIGIILVLVFYKLWDSDILEFIFGHLKK